MTPAQLFRLFRQALRACQLYPAESPAREESADRLWQALAAHAPPEGISIAFTDDGLYVDGQPVSEQDDAGTPLGGRLFELGLGELRFLPGIARAEVRRLLELLHGAIQGLFNPVDEDLSIVLWESELAHVTYWLYGDDHWWEGTLPDDESDYGEEPASEAAALEDLEEHAGEFVSRRDLALDVARPDSSARSPAGARARAPIPYRGTPLADYVEEEIRPSSEVPVLSSCRLSEEERLRILSAHRQDMAIEMPWKYGLLLIEVLKLEEDGPDAERIGQLLSAYLDALLDTGRFSLLSRLGQALRAGPSTRSGANDPTRESPPNDAQQAAARWFDAPETVARLVADLSAEPGAGETSATLADREAAREWFLQVPGELLVACLTGIDLDGEERLAPLVDARLSSDEAFFDQVLARGPERWLHRALVSLREVSPERARRLRELARTGPHELRAAALRALARATDRMSVGLLAETLHDPDSRLRVLAADALAEHGGRGLEPLLRVVVARDFERRDAAEQRALLVAAGRSSPQEVFPVLARMAESRALWPPRALPRRGRLALDALAALGSEAHDFAVLRWSSKRRDLVRRLDGLTPPPSAGRKVA